jgi:hypothetical protein
MFNIQKKNTKYFIKINELCYLGKNIGELVQNVLNNNLQECPPGNTKDSVGKYNKVFGNHIFEIEMSNYVFVIVKLTTTEKLFLSFIKKSV